MGRVEGVSPAVLPSPVPWAALQQHRAGLSCGRKSPRVTDRKWKGTVESQTSWHSFWISRQLDWL